MLDKIEDAVSVLDPKGSVEIDRQGGQLQLTFADGSTYLFNLYSPLEELWLSSPLSGAHHFNCRNGLWETSKGLALKGILEQELSQFLGKEFRLQ